MNLLRLYCPLRDMPSHCRWALISDKAKPAHGESPLAGLPRGADRIELIIPAPEVLITHARLPPAARRSAGSVLAYAIEERTANEPDANQVSWLGRLADDDVLAVLDGPGLQRWRNALAKVGIRSYEVHSEMLLLPWVQGEWSLAWNGQEGFIRTGKLDAAATDSGDRASPPMALRLLLERSEFNGGRPTALALYTSAEESLPDVEAWRESLGVPIRLAGSWDWRSAGVGEGVALAQERARWHALPGTASQLRAAAWIVGIALTLHTLALVVDWTLLSREQRSLRRQLDAQFRTTFPEAVAVVDPQLQMRRKLAEARHAAGHPDAGDFLPMIEKVAPEMKNLPAGAVRILSYEGGRLTLELRALDESTLTRIVSRLRQAGLSADGALAGAGRASTILTVRVS